MGVNHKKVPDIDFDDKPPSSSKHPLSGKRIRLIKCADPKSDRLPGSIGTISFVDAIGTVFVMWDEDGSRTGLSTDDGDVWEFLSVDS